MTYIRALVQKPVSMINDDCTGRRHPFLQVTVMLCLSTIVLVVYVLFHSPFNHASDFLPASQPQPRSDRRRISPSRLSPNHDTVHQQSEPCSITTRTAGRDPLDGRWYNFSSNNYHFYAYSAFVDDRPSLLSQPVIRIVSVASYQEVVVAKNVSVTLLCRLHYEGDDEVRIVPMVREHKPTSFGWTLIGDVIAREYLYTCGLDQSVPGLPIAVSILRSQHEDSSNHQLVQSCMPVELPAKPNTIRDFAICVPVAFGFVDLRYSDNIYPTALTRTQNVLQSSPVINDCMYRHMHSFKHMLVLDVDELIIPDGFMTLHELVAFLDRILVERPVNYVFRNSHFFLDIPMNDTSRVNGRSYNLTLLKHRMKVSLCPPGHRVKSIINPQACVIMHNHYCWSLTPGFEWRPSSGDVDPSIATNRHYKRCHWEPAECRQQMRTASYDGVMLRFADALEHSVRKRLDGDELLRDLVVAAEAM